MRALSTAAEAFRGRTVRDVTTLLLALLALSPLSSRPAEGQVLNRLKKAAERALGEAITCLWTDAECIARAEKQGKDVVLTNEQGDTLAAPLLTAEVDEEVLGAVPDRGGAWVISPDGAHAAVPGLEGSRQVIVVDGASGPAFDEVYFRTFAFGLRGGHYAYMARRGGDCFVVHDGKEIWSGPAGRVGCDDLLFRRRDETSRAIYLPGFHFAASGRVAFGVLRGRQITVHFGDTQGAPIARSPSTQILVRGDRVFYTGGGFFIDHEPQSSSGHQVNRMVVSRDGDHYAYVDVGKGGERVVVDGTPGPEYSQVRDLYMDVRNGAVFYTGASTDGRGVNYHVVADQEYVYSAEDVGHLGQTLTGHLANDIVHVGARPVAYLAGGGTQWGLCLHDGAGTGPAVEVDCALLRGPSTNRVVFTADGTRHAFMTRTRSRGGWVVQNGGQHGLEYEGIGSMGFTAAGGHLVYIASNGGRYFVVVDGKEIGPLDPAGGLTIAGRGDAYAFRAGKSSEQKWYVNGQALEHPLGEVGTLYFSSDGAHHAFSVERRFDTDMVLVDGDIQGQTLGAFRGAIGGGPYTYVEPPASPPIPEFRFDASGARVAFVTSGGGAQSLIVDGEMEISLDNGVIATAAFSPSGENLAYLVFRSPYGEKPSVTLYVDGQQGPVIGTAVPETVRPLRFLDERTIQTVTFRGNDIVRHTIRF